LAETKELFVQSIGILPTSSEIKVARYLMQDVLDHFPYMHLANNALFEL